MKKLLLVFMSMFFVLGTSMAQDDNAFKLVSVNPSSDNPVTSVYQIQLEFSKDISVTLPEGGIDVVNNETKEVLKLTRLFEAEWMPKNVAAFLFEQKAVTDKDGKEEMQDQYLQTPGTYSYTIPAGCIKSVDGEEFAGQTFTFSIVTTFPIDGYSPVNTDKLEKIELTFSEEIVKVVMPSAGMSIVDNYWTPVATIKNDVVISEDKKTMTLELETPITTPGQYNLDIYQGVFVSNNGISAYHSLFFNVIDTNPSFSLNYENGDRVQELGNLEITFNNVKEVKLIENGPKVAAYLPGGGEAEGTATLADGKITVTFEQSFTEQGEYWFVVPAGMFTMDGVANEELQVAVTLYTLTITPLEVVSVTPTVGETEQLEKIVVKFNQPIQLSMDENWQQISREIKLTCDDGKEYILTNDPGFGTNAADELVYLANAEWVDNAYKSTPITVAGVYTLNLADIVVDHAAEEGIDEWGYPATIWHAKKQSCAGTCVWTVTGGSAVEKIEVAAGEQVIYDLLGRRIEKIAGAGIYIVNGKKVVIK